MTTKYAARALESGRWQWISGGKTYERDAREYADKYRKRHGKLHAAWGGGNLASAVTADGGLPPGRRANDPDFLRAMAITCGLLAARVEAHGAEVAA